MVLGSLVHATTANFFTTVERVVSDSQWFGGCMALLGKRPDSVGLDCEGSFVSFSCTGDFIEKDKANRHFEMAQVALLTGAQVQFVVDDTKKHNGYCFVKRMDMVAP